MATGIPKTNWHAKMKRDHESTRKSFGRLELTYPAKKTVESILRKPAASISQVWPEESHSQNKLFLGDNLQILASLIKNEEIRGKVRLIYIDPPFATKSIFQSRNQVNAYTDLLSGAEYLEFIRERLILLRELLADNGSIYVHLDDTMMFHVKIIMDEVFGSENYRNCIVRKKCNSKNATKNSFGNVVDYILFYSKTDNYIWNRAYEDWSEERMFQEYCYIEENTGRRYKKVPIHAPGTRNGETGQPWRGMLPPPGKHWQYTPAKLDELDSRGEIYWSKNGNPRRKIYLDQSKGVAVSDTWLEFLDAHNQNILITGYPTEKNGLMMERIIKASSNEGDLVLDCFCGSGTTLTAAKKHGRKWIGIDNSTLAITTTINRLLFGTSKMGDYVTTRKDTESGKSSTQSQQILSSFQNRPSSSNEKPNSADFIFFCQGELYSDAVKLKDSILGIGKIKKLSKKETVHIMPVNLPQLPH